MITQSHHTPDSKTGNSRDTNMEILRPKEMCNYLLFLYQLFVIVYIDIILCKVYNANEYLLDSRD